eukprot:jgi/Ulvmu1/12330/UM089_0014.1
MDLCPAQPEAKPGEQMDPAHAASVQPNNEEDEEPVVTAHEVKGKVDYKKLCEQFGCSLISPDLVARIERVTGVEAHPFLKRGVFYAHRDLDQLLDMYEAGKKFYLYTGRGPSSEALHLGHLIPFMFTKWLQDAFKCPLVVQLTDDEKCLWKGLPTEEARRLARENCKDIIACGFDVRKTFIFSDFEYVGGAMYRVASELQGRVNINQVKKIFGLTDECSVGKAAFCAIQAAPSFSTIFPHMFSHLTNVPCLIPCAIDQDPYFRLTRDHAEVMGFVKPALIESQFFPALQGDTGKMSASVVTSAIFVSDSPKDIKDKINKHALSGGRQTVEEHREKGADLAVDVPYKWLRFFLDDAARFDEITRDYGSGAMLTGEVKQQLISVLQDLVGRHQRARAMVSDAVVEAFMQQRDMPDLWGP